MKRSTVATAAACVAIAAGCFFGARAVARGRGAPPIDLRAHGAEEPRGPELVVPHAKGAITLDGDLDDEGWRGPVARTGAFVLADGNEARPYSDARLAWGDGHLYLALYAADEDIRAPIAEPDAPLWTGDAFRMAFRGGGIERAIEISPLGAITDGERAEGAGAFDYAWDSGAHVSFEHDGTPNASDDDDEEWALEVAIPFESLGLSGVRGERIALQLRRCDTPKRGGRVCASWGETTLVLQ